MKLVAREHLSSVMRQKKMPKYSDTIQGTWGISMTKWMVISCSVATQTNLSQVTMLVNQQAVVVRSFDGIGMAPCKKGPEQQVGNDCSFHDVGRYSREMESYRKYPLIFLDWYQLRFNQPLLTPLLGTSSSCWLLTTTRVQIISNENNYGTLNWLQRRASPSQDNLFFGELPGAFVENRRGLLSRTQQPISRCDFPSANTMDATVIDTRQARWR